MKELEILKYFSDALTYRIPLGVCMLFALAFTLMFMRLQSNRRKDYASVIEGHQKLNLSLQRTIDAKENRIRELELRIEKVYTDRTGG